MAQPAGSQYTVFNQRIWFAPVGTKLPKINAPYGADWSLPTVGDAAWKRLEYTEEGAVISPAAPKDDIPADEVGGSIGVVPSGGSEITIGFTPLTPNLDLFTWLASFQMQQDVAKVTDATTPANSMPAYKRFSLNPGGKQFMIGIEGTFQQGSLNENGGFVRAFGYRVEQTDEVEITMRTTGEDAVVKLEASVRCLVTKVAATQLTGTGMTQADSRFDWYFIPNEAVV